MACHKHSSFLQMYHADHRGHPSCACRSMHQCLSLASLEPLREQKGAETSCYKNEPSWQMCCAKAVQNKQMLGLLACRSMHQCLSWATLEPLGEQKCVKTPCHEWAQLANVLCKTDSQRNLPACRSMHQCLSLAILGGWRSRRVWTSCVQPCPLPCRMATFKSQSLEQVF